MGIWSGSKKVIGTVINIRVDKWVGIDQLKEGFTGIYGSAKGLFTSAKPETEETFEQALERLDITEEDLQDRKKEFTRLFLFYLMVGLALFAYGVYLLIFKDNMGGILITTALTIYCFINVFRFHFWLFQIKKRKLGCTISEWLNG